MRKAIRHFLNKRGYEIIKQPYIGDRFPDLSKKPDTYYAETPIGKYFLPVRGLEQDAVANTLVRGKFYDGEIIDIAKQYIKKGTSVIDIGANFGQMTIEFSKAAGSDGEVFSFEAQDFVYRYLQQNIAANNCNNVQLFHNAVWETAGKTMYFPEPDLSGPAPYSGNTVTVEAKTNPVQTVTIDSIDFKKPVSFMKIDIEGADIFALRGAKETMLKHRMPVIFEFTQHMQIEYGTTFQDYVELVRSVNYRFAEVITDYNYLILPE